MKRRDLERHLAEHGARLLREGANHSFWGLDAERSTAVPRHREIAFGLARKICKDSASRRQPARARPVVGCCSALVGASPAHPLADPAVLVAGRSGTELMPC